MARAVADKGVSEAAWLLARRAGVTATEVRDIVAGRKSVARVVAEKRSGGVVDLSRVPAVRHGVEREPVIAEWVERRFGILPSDTLYRAEENSGYLATPDGVGEVDGELCICEIKTSTHDVFPGSERYRSWGYADQVQWQLFVTGVRKCLFVWEQHEDFVPVALEPAYAWVVRDEARIGVLRAVADDVLAVLGQDFSVYEAEVARLAGIVWAGRVAEGELRALGDVMGGISWVGAEVSVQYSAARTRREDVPDADLAVGTPYEEEIVDLKTRVSDAESRVAVARSLLSDADRVFQQRLRALGYVRVVDWPGSARLTLRPQGVWHDRVGGVAGVG